jgi:2-methylcitrate dehydratase PrpD
MVAKRQADIPEPSTEWMASLSIQYGAAVALVEGAVGVEHFTRQYFESPKIRAVMRKVEVVVDERITAAFPGKVVMPRGGHRCGRNT